MQSKIEVLEEVLEMVPIYNRMRELGFISFFCAHREDMGIQMDREAFMYFFPIHETKPYHSTGDKWGREAYYVFNGQRFFTLLDNEEFEEDEDV